MTEIRAPKMVKSEAKPSIGRWFKRAGDAVSRDEPLVEIIAENERLEVRAATTGVLSEILVADGGFVEPDMLLGTITTY